MSSKNPLEIAPERMLSKEEKTGKHHLLTPKVWGLTGLATSDLIAGKEEESASIKQV